MKHECVTCGFVYDEDEGYPAEGIAPGTPFSDLDPDWTCPDCSASLEDFSELAA